jgi:hypothetical protein
MKPKKERAALAPRERKTASLPTILAETHCIRPRKQALAARNPSPPNQSTRRVAEQAMVLSPIGLHRFCKSQKQARSTVTFRMTERRNNHRFSPANRRSPSSKTTALAPKAPAGTLL